MNTPTGHPEEYNQFSIKKAFLCTLNFSSPRAPVLLLGISNSTKIDKITTKVLSTETDEPSKYYVAIDINIKSSAGGGYIVQNLSFDYLVCVVIHDKSLKKKSIRRILNTIVPQNLYNEINSVIFNTTSQCHCPVLLDKDTFVSSIKDKGLKKIHSNPDEERIVPLGETVDYHWLINRLSSIEGFDGLASTYNKSTGGNTTDNYENQPAYKYYLRFFVPIQYNHPDFEECDESVWAMLFQLLFSNFDTTCKVIDTREGLPEIEFSRENYHHVKISELSLEDLIDLLKHLLIEMFSDVSICLTSLQNINKQQFDTTQPERPIRQSGFYKLFGFDNIELIPQDELEQLEKLYAQIKDCDLQTRIYRHQSEQNPDFDGVFF